MLLAGGAGALATGVVIGVIAGEVAAPERRSAGSSSVEVPIRRVAVTAPPAPIMEEPLPTDIYVPPPRAPETPAPVSLGKIPPSVAVPAAPTAKPPRIVETTPAWQRNARPFVSASGRPVVAVVIDDLGLDHARSERALRLDPAVTTAFMTYAQNLSRWLAQARAGGHELLVHMPMQPESASVDPGPNALTVSLSEDEVLRRLRWGLARMDGYVGVNNHMGSRFTEDAAGMRIVLSELKARELLFLDSRTTPRTSCGPIAHALDLPFASRNVFLDNEETVPAVRQQIITLETVARRHGMAIGIGHPHDATLTALAEWLPEAANRGITIVPLTSATRHGAERA